MLVVTNVWKTFVVKRTRTIHRVAAVQGVSFEINSGESLGLVGASGSGKSTLGRCILQLERPDEGEVLFGGNDLCALRGRRLRQARLPIQAVFQEPISSLDPRLPIGQSVAEPLEVSDIGAREKLRRVEAALERVGLGGRYNSRPAELSGGEAQRVAIARAIIGDPKLVLLDEPTSALDVSIQAQVLNLLLELRADLKCALLFISHDLGVVNVMCGRVLVMRHGEIVEAGPTRQILDRPEHSYTAALVGVARGPSLMSKAAI